MRRIAWQTLIIVFLSSLAVSCTRSTQDAEEVKALRQEVQTLRTELERKKTEATVSVASTQAVDAPPVSALTPESTEFFRASRRIVNAMGAGVTYLDFGQRLVEVSASAEEALPKITARAQKAKITDFVQALHDANNLWRYKTSSESDRMRLQMIAGTYAPVDFPRELGDRWNSNFPELVKKYGLRNEKDLGSPIIDYGNRPEMLFDRTLRCIFAYATKSFRELEKTQ